MEQRISTTTASRLLRVSKSTIQRQIKAGNLKAEMQKVSQGGGNCGMSNMIPVSEVLQQLDTQGRLLWYESQSGLSTQVSAADLATYKEAFGEEGLTELANRQQAVMALDGILNAKIEEATAAGCKVSLRLELPARLMDEIDCCTVVGNLWDNAIRANSVLPQNVRGIKFTIGPAANFCRIRCENPLPPAGALPPKNDGQEHGIGLRQVCLLYTSPSPRDCS